MFRASALPVLNRIVSVFILILLSATVAWSGGVKVLHNFGSVTKTPSSGLVTDTAGSAYGTTAVTGQSGGGAGAVYELSPTGYQNIYIFAGSPDGREPQGNLVIDAAGNLYGTTVYGGANKAGCNGHGCGTVFRLMPPTSQGGSWTETVLYSFTGGNDGSNPQASVILDSAGNLYGTAENGGNLGAGTVFELIDSGNGQWTESVIYSMSDGAFPLGGLIFDSVGNLYGTTSQFGGGAGTVFELSPPQPGGGWTYARLYSFGAHGGNDGLRPAAGVVFEATDNLYGTTSAGGEFGFGTVFELTSNDGGWTERILYSFAGKKDGATPLASLVLDQAGNLYGTTFAGGSSGAACQGNGCGTVFELTPTQDGQWTERLFVFPSDASLGRQPTTPLTLDQAGRAYGTTTLGGSVGWGVVFRIAR